MTLLSRDQIIDASDIVIETVPVPEWASEANPDAHVNIKGMTGAERDELDMRYIELRKKTGKAAPTSPNLRARMVAQCAVDEHGKRLFTEADIELLGRKSAAALDRLFTVAQRLSGFNDADIKDLEKNSESGPSDSSTSSSR